MQNIDNNDAQQELLLNYKYFGMDEIFYSGILSEKLQLEMIRKDKNSIKYFSNPTITVLSEVYGNQLEQMLEGRSKVPKKYQYLINATEDVQVAGVSKDGYAILHIENPSEAVQLVALEQSFFSQNPTKKVQRTALMKSIDNLAYLRYVTPIEDFNEIMKEIVKDPKTKRQYIIEFLKCRFIEGDIIEFVNRYGSSEARIITMEYVLGHEL